MKECSLKMFYTLIRWNLLLEFDPFRLSSFQFSSNHKTFRHSSPTISPIRSLQNESDAENKYKTVYKRIMIVDFYDYLELLSKAVYEIFFRLYRSFALDFFSPQRKKEENTFYDHQTESRL